MFLKNIENKLVDFWRKKTKNEKELFFAVTGTLGCLWMIFSFRKEIIIATLLIVGFCFLEEKLSW